MPGVAVGLHLQEGGSPAGARGGQSRSHRRERLVGVLSVHDDPRNTVGGGPVGQIFDGSGQIDSAVLPVLVVLAYEHHGQLPDSRQVQALVEGADVGSPSPNTPIAASSVPRT